MRPEDLRQFLGQEPFRPFRVTLTDGREYEIRHPELVALGRSSLFIGFPRPDDPLPVYDHYEVVSLSHVVHAQRVDSMECSREKGAVMEEVVLRLADVRDSYYRAKDQIARQRPAWDEGNDVRLTMFFKIANVLNCTQHGLTHLALPMLEEDWWQKHTDCVPTFEVRVEQAAEFYMFCKVGCFHGVFSMLECSLRQIVRTLDSTACSNGSAEFMSIYSWLLRRLGLEAHKSLLDLLRRTRNTFHNNGYYFHKSGSDQAVTHKDITYEFHLAQPVEFVTWDFMLDRFNELREFLKALVTSPEMADASEIRES